MSTYLLNISVSKRKQQQTRKAVIRWSQNGNSSSIPPYYVYTVSQKRGSLVLQPRRFRLWTTATTRTLIVSVVRGERGSGHSFRISKITWQRTHGMCCFSAFSNSMDAGFSPKKQEATAVAHAMSAFIIIRVRAETKNTKTTSRCERVPEIGWPFGHLFPCRGAKIQRIVRKVVPRTQPSTNAFSCAANTTIPIFGI